eukprot:TRINITY_DN3991_c0_g1_i3.p1 TRINITY_DN3991_c0_g1~~TRINITY_DN3991_c0_g1_i3.p1  ORF type:complete len:623 (-),score=68.20 TRINITY_DN3991_c0_g1_i3:78-1910(-)
MEPLLPYLCMQDVFNLRQLNKSWLRIIDETFEDFRRVNGAKSRLVSLVPINNKRRIIKNTSPNAPVWLYSNATKESIFGWNDYMKITVSPHQLNDNFFFYNGVCTMGDIHEDKLHVTTWNILTPLFQKESKTISIPDGPVTRILKMGDKAAILKSEKTKDSYIGVWWGEDGITTTHYTVKRVSEAHITSEFVIFDEGPTLIQRQVFIFRKNGDQMKTRIMRGSFWSSPVAGANFLFDKNGIYVVDLSTGKTRTHPAESVPSIDKLLQSTLIHTVMREDWIMFSYNSCVRMQNVSKRQSISFVPKKTVVDFWVVKSTPDEVTLMLQSPDGTVFFEGLHHTWLGFTSDRRGSRGYQIPDVTELLYVTFGKKDECFLVYKQKTIRMCLDSSKVTYETLTSYEDIRLWPRPFQNYFEEKIHFFEHSPRMELPEYIIFVQSVCKIIQDAGYGNAEWFDIQRFRLSDHLVITPFEENSSIDVQMSAFEELQFLLLFQMILLPRDPHWERLRNASDFLFETISEKAKVLSQGLIHNRNETYSRMTTMDLLPIDEYLNSQFPNVVALGNKLRTTQDVVRSYLEWKENQDDAERNYGDYDEDGEDCILMDCEEDEEMYD